MNPGIDAAAGGVTPIARPAGDARLRSACAQLEGVFLEQVMKALRETIPEGGVIDGGTGEDIFSGLMDSHLSGQAAERWGGTLATALYRQLRGEAPGRDDNRAVPASVAGPEAKLP